MKRGSDKRLTPRVPLTGEATVLFGNQSTEVMIGNISLSGVLFYSQQIFGLGDVMTICFRGAYRETEFNESALGKVVTIIRKDKKNSYGLQFSTYLSLDQQPFLTGFVNRTRGKEISFLRDPQYSRAERKE